MIAERGDQLTQEEIQFTIERKKRMNELLDLMLQRERARTGFKANSADLETMTDEFLLQPMFASYVAQTKRPTVEHTTQTYPPKVRERKETKG